MASKPELDMTDEEIDALVAAVSDEMGVEIDDGLEDEDFDVDIATSEKDKTVVVQSPSPAHKSSVQSLGATDESSKQLPGSADKSSLQSLGTDSSQSNTSHETVRTLGADATLEGQAAKLMPLETETDAAERQVSGRVCQKSESNLPLNTLIVSDKNTEVFQSADQPNEQLLAVSETTEIQKINKYDVADDEIVKSEKSLETADNVDSGSKQPLREPEKDKKKRPRPSADGGGGWGWGNLSGWGSSVISSATAITNQVGESFYHVLEKVESSLVEPAENTSSNVVSKQDDDGKPPSSPDSPPVEVLLRPPGGAVKEQISCDRQTAATNDEVGNLDACSREKSETDDQSSLSTRKLTEEFMRNERTACKMESSVEQAKSVEASVSMDFETKNVGARMESSNRSMGSRSIEKDKGKEAFNENAKQDGSWLSGWRFKPLTQLTGAGKRVVSTGLGVIGDIGKKTYNALMVEEDEEQSSFVEISPGKKRSVDSASKMPAFISRLDDGSGEAHMEALQELSIWSNGLLNKQLSSLCGNQVHVVRDDMAMIQESFNLNGIEELCDNETDHEFTQLTKDFMSQLGLKLDVEKLISIQQKTRSYLSGLSADTIDPKNVHDNAVKYFAEFTATSIAVLHKIGQLLLIEASVPLLAYKFRSLSIAGLTKVLCVELWFESNRFARLLNDFASSVGDENSVVAAASLATMVELEASNCSMSLRDACACLLPIMQLVVARTHPHLSDSSGIPHLESLQICSNMSRTNVRHFLKKLSDDSRKRFEIDLADLEAVFDLGFFQQDEDKDCHSASFGSHVCELSKLVVSGAEPAAAKLISTHARVITYLADCASTNRHHANPRNAKDIHQMAVQLLSELTASSVELYYSIAQLILLEQPHNVKLYAQKAENLASLTKELCIEVGNLSTQFTQCLSSAESDGQEAATPFVTNVYLEASSSSTNVQDGFHLLLPVFQLAFIKASPLLGETAESG